MGDETPPQPANTNVQEGFNSLKAWANKHKGKVSLEKRFHAYMNEFEILASICHPNVIGLDKVFVTNQTLYIFQDLITAGDLFSYFNSKNNKLIDAEAAVIIRQVVIAVDFLHDRNIAHRDLKPENIMLTSLATRARLVLTDFGSARRILPMQRATTLAGTEEYGAPEMLKRTCNYSAKKNGFGYSLAADMWSIGAISVLLLVGFRAFDNCYGDHDSALAVKGDLAKLEDNLSWRAVGERPKNFMRRLVEIDEQDRMTAKEALNHPWFSNDMHKVEFESLHQWSVQYWKPRMPSNPLVDFVHGKSDEVRRLESSQKILGELPQFRKRSAYTPVGPPYKPFYRKLYEQSGLWPRRKRGRSISEELKKVITAWAEVTKDQNEKRHENDAAPRNPPRGAGEFAAQSPMKRAAVIPTEDSVEVTETSESIAVGLGRRSKKRCASLP